MRLSGERKRVSLRGSASGSFSALIQCETMHHRLCSRHHTSRLPISAQRSEVGEMLGKDHHFQAKEDFSRKVRKLFSLDEWIFYPTWFFSLALSGTQPML